MSQLSVHDILGLSAYSNKIRIPSGHALEVEGNLKFPVWTSSTRPSGPETGSLGYNSETAVLELYNGTAWVNVGDPRLTGTTATTAGYAAAEVIQGLSAPSPTARWIKPDNYTAFQCFVCDNLASLGTIPSGGPQWAYNITGLNIVSKSLMNQTDSMDISFDNWHKLVNRLYNGTNTSPYFYWAVFDTSINTLAGITRTYFTNGTFETWKNHHTGDSPSALSPNGGSMVPHWDVWGTTFMNGGTYTISNDTSNHVRSWDYYQSNGSSKGLHYKRTGSGEHYPWRNSSRVMTSEGYFYPSSSRSLYGWNASGSGTTHYIFVAEN
tara:strand:- start:186 stop:1154 length:969 start_codon:yes stop_codon:yes gene_type:complete